MELVKRSDMYTVPFTRLRLAPDNGRIDFGDIDELMENILENGVKEALYGYSGKDPELGDVFFAKNGSRRFKAMERIYKERGIEISCPFRLQPKKTHPEQDVLDRILLNDGKPYTPYELSKEIEKLINYGWDTKKVAQKLGRSETNIVNLLSLAGAPMHVQNVVANGSVSATLAIKTLAKGSEAVDELVQKAQEAPKEPDSKPDLFQEGDKPKEPKKTRVTAKDLAPQLNSWKEFKEWARMADKKKMNPTPQACFILLCQIMNNEAKVEDFNDFFY
jgi:hypothetical protein